MVVRLYEKGNEMAATEVRGPGRPPIYTGKFAENIVKVLKQYGLKGGRRVLETEGVQVKPGTPKQKVKVSLPTLGKLAKNAGVTFKLGRPPLAA